MLPLQAKVDLVMAMKEYAAFKVPALLEPHQQINGGVLVV